MHQALTLAGHTLNASRSRSPDNGAQQRAPPAHEQRGGCQHEQVLAFEQRSKEPHAGKAHQPRAVVGDNPAAWGGWPQESEGHAS